MSYPYRREITYSFGGPLTPAVKAIIIANGAVFLFQVMVPAITGWLSLSPPLVLPFNLQLWRVVTYMFLHGGVGHLVWNMLFLFMFGCTLERTWGTKRFYRYYFICGLGAALFAFIPYGPFYQVPIVGASGAIYGILLAYGVIFPMNKIWILATFPVEARYLVIVLGFVAFASSLMGSDGVAHIVHLGGLVTGYVVLRYTTVVSRSAHPSTGGVVGPLRDAYRRWRMKRLKKKFESYYEKRSGGGNGPTIVH
jgi:membrane associated rhomboid family serine protease